MGRKLILAAPILALVLIAASFSPPPGREMRTIKQFETDRAALTQLAQQVLDTGNTEDILPPAPWTGVELFDSGVPAVEFSMGGSGVGSSTKYWGINYVPSDSMVGFQGQRWDYWKQEGDGRLYYDPESDNTCYVKKLDNCWYYYEMSF